MKTIFQSSRNYGHRPDFPLHPDELCREGLLHPPLAF